MKKISHYINIFLCIILAALGIVMLVSRPVGPDGTSALVLISAVFQIIMSCLLLFMGALLPQEGRYISKRMQIFLKILLALAVLGDERVSPAAYEAADGRIRLERFWEPAFPLACLAIESIFFYFAPTEGLPYIVIILSKALFILLIVFTLIWRIAEQKENGTFKWLNAVGPSLVIVVIFGAISAYTFIQDWRQGASLSEELAETRAEINRILESPSGQTEDGETSQDSLDMDGVISMVRRDLDFSGKTYYRWLIGEDDTCSMVVWTDDSEDVYVYQFIRHGDLYDYDTSFVSGSINREEVEGKQDGSWDSSK